ncbi:MAG: TolC family protein [Nevskiaceae bacterium]|nr:MAG: TolC family protein [Nevskiaceae bacterium]
MVSKSIPFARTAVVLAALSLTACASLPPDLGRADVASAVSARGQPLPSGDTQRLSAQLLAQPLTPDNAITLALIHNPAVRQTTARLGLAAADVYDAARIANPIFSATRLTSNDPAAVSAQIGLGIALSFTDLILLPARSRYAKAQFEAAKLEVGSATLLLASEVQTSWYALAGAEQDATLKARVAKAAQASADLAQRFLDAGNITKRELALEKAAAAQAQLSAQAAQANAVQARSALNRQMGLPASQDQWQLAGGLPAPFATEDDLDALLKLAAESRLDVAAARKNAEAIASAYGLERRTRLIGPIDLSYQRERETDGSRLIGPGLSLSIPIFNWGTGRVTRAKALLDAAEADLAATELDASNDVKAAHAGVQSAKALVERYRDGLIPQREAVVDQMQLEVNFMLIGVFELLAAKQQQYDAYSGYLDAVRDYWLARTELTRAVGRRLPSSDQPTSDALDAEVLAKPKGGGMNHGAMGHDMSSMEGMEGMDMKGMEGMDMSSPGESENKAPPAANPHAGHSGHGASAKDGEKKPTAAKASASKPAMNHSGHDMSGMPGMEGMEMPDKESSPKAGEEMPIKQNPQAGHEGHTP